MSLSNHSNLMDENVHRKNIVKNYTFALSFCFMQTPLQAVQTSLVKIIKYPQTSNAKSNLEIEACGKIFLCS